MDICNTRAVRLNNKEAAQIRLALLHHLDIEKIPIDQSSRIMISHLISSFLLSRIPKIGEEVYRIVNSMLRVKEIYKKRIGKSILVNPNSLGYVIDYIFQYSLSHQNMLPSNQNLRKTQGAYYTPFEIADYMVRNTIKCKFITKKKLKILDPACGSGVFLSSAAFLLAEKGYKIDDILFSLHGWDKNGDALTISKLLISGELALNNDTFLEFINSSNFVEKDTLLENRDSYNLFSRQKSDTKKFDYIIANPPYDRLKPDNLPTTEKEAVLHYVKTIKSSNQYPLSSTGSLDLYRLFLEYITNILDTSSKASIIIPMSFTNDKSAQPLRKYLIEKSIIKKVVFMPEKIRAFEGVNQAFCIIFLHKSTKETMLETCTPTNTYNFTSTAINQTKISTLQSTFDESSNIIDMSERSYQLVSHLNKFPKISDITNIQNRRGELDLTFHKDLLGCGTSKLLRGKNISEYTIKNYEAVNYDKFIERVRNTSKYEDILSSRIACQQITNMGSKKRLKFTIVPPEIILSNSLNYISFQSDCKNYLYGFLTIMNSILMDWRFRITSSNNHVNNYELDKLPIPESTEGIKRLGKYFRENSNKIFDINFRRGIEMKVLGLFHATDFQDIILSEHPLGNHLKEGAQNNLLGELEYA